MVLLTHACFQSGNSAVAIDSFFIAAETMSCHASSILLSGSRRAGTAGARLWTIHIPVRHMPGNPGGQERGPEGPDQGILHGVQVERDVGS